MSPRARVRRRASAALWLLCTAGTGAHAAPPPCDPDFAAELGGHLASTHPAIAAFGERARAREADADAAAAFSDPMLQLDVRGAPVVEPWNLGRTMMGGVGVGVTQPIPWLPRLDAKKRGHLALADAERALAEEQRLAFVSEALGLLVEAERAERIAALLDEQRALFLATAEVARATASVSPDGIAQAMLLEASAVRLEAESQSVLINREAALARYVTLVGEGGPEACRLDLERRRLEPVEGDAAPARPLLAAFDARARSADENAAAAEAAWVPEPRLQLGYVWRPASSAADPHAPSDDVDFLAGAIQIPLPLAFSQRTGPLARARADRAMAEAERAAFLRRVAGDVEAARARIDAENATLRKLEDEALPVTLAAADAAKAAYQTGRGPLSAFLEAERLHIDVQLSAVEAMARRARAELALLGVLGRPEAFLVVGDAKASAPE